MRYNVLKDTPYLFQHKPRGWLISLGFVIPEGKEWDEKGCYYTLEINGTNYSEMSKAPPRERADLARTSITLSMSG